MSRIALFALLGGIVAAATPAAAQDQARLAAGRAVWDKAGCSSCHGRDAGGGEGGEQPVGPSLRRLRMERDLIVQTIACGRPSTPMPANLAGAYTQTSCYDMAVGKAPDGIMIGATLTTDEIAALTDYIQSLR